MQTALLVIRVLLSIFKFAFFAYESRRLDADGLAQLFYIMFALGIGVIFCSTEIYYGFVRRITGRNDDDQTVINEHFNVTSTHLLVIFVTCALALSLGFGSHISPYISGHTPFLLLLIVIFECLNTDAYRYFQINSIPDQIISLIFRSFVPFVAFMAHSVYAPNVSIVVFLYYLLSCSAIVSIWSLRRLRVSLHFPGRREIDNWWRAIRQSLTIAMPIVLLQFVYMSYDKQVAARIMPSSQYANYSFYSNIGQIVILYVQITKIQPMLSQWYSRTSEFIDKKDILKSFFELFVLFLVGCFSLALGSSLLGASLRPNFTSYCIVLGYLSAAFSGYFGAFMYARQLDRPIRNIEFITAVSAILCLTIFSTLSSIFFLFPIFIYSISLILRVFVLKRLGHFRVA